METPVRQSWTATARTVVFALMAAAVLLSIVSAGLLPFTQRLEPERAALLRRGGDNLMLAYYLLRARGWSAAEAEPFLIWAGDLYSAALEAEPSNFELSLCAGIVLRELGDAGAVRSHFPPLRRGQFDEKTRRALGGVYALAMARQPSLSAVERSREYLAGLTPGALLIASAYLANGKPELAQSTLQSAARQARPLITRLTLTAIINGIILLSGLGLVAWRIARRRPRDQPAAEEFPPPTRWGSRESVEALILWLFLSGALGSAAVTLAPLAGAPPAYLLLAPGLLSMALAVGWVWLVGRPGAAFGWQLAGALRQVALGVSAAGLAVIPALGIYGLLRLLMGVRTADSPVLPLLMAPDTVAAKALLVTAIGVATPALEETLFRGILFGGLRRRWSYWPAAVVSAAIFALVHQHLAGFVTYLLLGLIFAHLFERSGSLVAPWAAHGAFNIFNLMLLFAVFG